MTDHLTPAERAAVGHFSDHEHRDPTNEELAAAIRHPDTLALIRGICRTELVRRLGEGQDIPADWINGTPEQEAKQATPAFDDPDEITPDETRAVMQAGVKARPVPGVRPEITYTTVDAHIDPGTR